MKRFCFAFTIFTSLLSCQKTTINQMVQGEWRYKAINFGDSSIYVSENDYLKINSDSTFHYEVMALRKNKNGNWKTQNQELILEYTEPDTTYSTNFKITFLSKWSMTIVNGNRRFEFFKE